MSGITAFLHKDLENTTHMVTGPSGSLIQDQTFYPWGQSWHSLGTWYQQQFAGLDYFDPASSVYFSLSRNYNPTPGRWMSPDPFNASVLHIVNPQRWNRYAYALNSPTTLIDPNGLSAIAVNFQDEVTVPVINYKAGHEGFVSIHDDGTAVYARFGPVGGGRADGPGQVDVYPLAPIPMGGDGVPTDAGYASLTLQVAAREGQDISTVRMNFFITSESETYAMDAWVQRIQARPPWYFFNSQNCATFTIVGLLEGHAITNSNISIIPNRLFFELADRATENESQGRRNPKPQVTSTITGCTTLKGEPCQ